MKRWTKEETKKFIEYRKNGKTAKEISCLLKRTIDSVEQKAVGLIKKGILKGRINFDMVHYEIGDSNLDVIGSLLYVCEGSKKRCIEFVNMDESFLLIFMKFLRQYTQDESRFRIRLKVGDKKQFQKYGEYWSKKLNIPLSQFKSPTIKPSTRHREGYKGVVTIKYYSRPLLYAVLKKGNDLIKNSLEF